jgi:hypothetical protein
MKEINLNLKTIIVKSKIIKIEDLNLSEEDKNDLLSILDRDNEFPTEMTKMYPKKYENKLKKYLIKEYQKLIK